MPRTLPPRLREMRMPTRRDLDVTTDHPVAFDGSYVWSANSKALEVSGITRNTPNPPGGEVVKDKNGEPNGILRNAAQLLKGAQRSETFTEQDKLAALEQMLQLYAEAGLTSVGGSRCDTGRGCPVREAARSEATACSRGADVADQCIASDRSRSNGRSAPRSGRQVLVTIGFVSRHLR